MIVSHSHRFVFIHVPKTGGTSVQAALTGYGWAPSPRPDRRDGWRRHWHRFRWALQKLGREVGLPGVPPLPLTPHSTACAVREHLGADVFDQYFTFAFVRNPWDLIVSQYEHRRRVTHHPEHPHVQRLGSFAAFVEWRLGTRPRRLLDHIADAQGRIIISRACRFESIESEFEAVCAHLGIRASLCRLNIGVRQPYQRYYDEESRQRVAHHYAAEIAKFGYEFE